MKRVMVRLAAAGGAAVLAFAALGGLLNGLSTAATLPYTAFVPLITGDAAPPVIAGTYDCYEYEFGLIWSMDVITLEPGGRGIFNHFSYLGVVTGTWDYAPVSQTVTFSGFRWPSAQYIPPDRLWKSRYLPEAGFEIALSCLRR